MKMYDWDIPYLNRQIFLFHFQILASYKDARILTQFQNRSIDTGCAACMAELYQRPLYAIEQLKKLHQVLSIALVTSMQCSSIPASYTNSENFMRANSERISTHCLKQQLRLKKVYFRRVRTSGGHVHYAISRN